MIFTATAPRFSGKTARRCLTWLHVQRRAVRGRASWTPLTFPEA